MAKRLLRARDYQDPRAPVRRIAELARPAIRRDLFNALVKMRDLVPVELIAKLIRNGLYWKVKDAIDWAHFEGIMRAPFDRIAETFEEGGRLGARKVSGQFHQRGRSLRYRRPGERGPVYKTPEWAQGLAQDGEWGGTLGTELSKDIGDRFNFNRFNQATQEKLRRSQDDLIRELSDGSRDAVDALIYQGATRGYSPEQIAGSIRDNIGLTAKQAQAVSNYARMLHELDPGALTRQLRNRTYDAAVREAIDTGSFLPDEAVDRLVREYADNYLDYRASTISQTESTRAANEGLNDAYRQAVETGALPDAAVRRNWQVALDEKTCEICRSIPEMNPDGVGVDEDFQSSDGPVDNPPIHPNCRCSVEYVTDLDKVPELEEVT